jgi:hypothetical protein
VPSINVLAVLLVLCNDLRFYQHVRAAPVAAFALGFAARSRSAFVLMFPSCGSASPGIVWLAPHQILSGSTFDHVHAPALFFMGRPVASILGLQGRRIHTTEHVHPSSRMVTIQDRVKIFR